MVRAPRVSGLPRLPVPLLVAFLLLLATLPSLFGCACGALLSPTRCTPPPTIIPTVTIMLTVVATPAPTLTALP